MYLRLAAREDALAKSAEQEDANKSQQPAPPSRLSASRRGNGADEQG